MGFYTRAGKIARSKDVLLLQDACVQLLQVVNGMRQVMLCGAETDPRAYRGRLDFLFAVN